MTNINCLAGIRCPKCGNTARFHIEATVTADVSDDGCDVYGDVYWDWLSTTSCAECNHEALLAEFRADAEVQP